MKLSIHTQEDTLFNHLVGEDNSIQRFDDEELHHSSPPAYADAIISQSLPIHPPLPSYELINENLDSTDEQLPRYNDSFFCQKMSQLGSSPQLQTEENIDVYMELPC